MKRRNVKDTTRRPVNRKIPKLYDGFYTSLVVYVKLLLMWICVMGGDFILEFRLEYLYPIYLLLHNSYEAYKFQGIAFALLLVCIVVSVDVICLGVIPAPWLYLLGSLAVWGQVGWNLTPLGPLLLLPTLIYIDGKSIRPLPTQPLSPLAAHCVGFPLVSLAFHLKSFIGARLKQRTKNDVARQNEVLYSVLWEALPFMHNNNSNMTLSPPVNNNEVISNGTTAAVLMKKQLQSPISPAAPRRKSIEVGESQLGSGDASPVISLSSSSSKSPSSVHHNQNHHNTSSNHVTQQQQNHNNNNNNNPSPSSNTSVTGSNSSSGSSPTTVSTVNPIVTPSVNANGTTQNGCLLVGKKKKDDCCFKSESEVRKLRSDLHVVRTIESELRGQIASLLTSERNLRGDIATLQGEHESLQLKYSALLGKCQEERQSYEKKLVEERRQKENAINKQKKASQECSGDCRRKLREAEREKESLRRDIKLLEDKNLRTDRELQNVKSTLMHEQKNKENSLPLLSALQDQNAHLESSLSAETRLKLELFAALGEARRQLQIRDSYIKSKEEELDEIRGQLVSIHSYSNAVTDFSNQQHQHDLQQAQFMKNNVVGMNECHPSSSPQQRNDSLNFSPLIES